MSGLVVGFTTDNCVPPHSDARHKLPAQASGQTTTRKNVGLQLLGWYSGATAYTLLLPAQYCSCGGSDPRRMISGTVADVSGLIMLRLVN